MPEEAFAPELNIHEVEEYDLSQYADSTRYNALIRGIIEIYNEHAFANLELFDRASNPHEIDGILLDWLARRIGLIRPRVRSLQQEFFGLAGTDTSGGRTLDQAPFYTELEFAQAYEPIQDTTFRCLIFARMRKLHGDIGRTAWNECLKHLQGGGGFIEMTRVADFDVTLTHHQLPNAMLQSLLQVDIARKVLPMIPGVKYHWRYRNHTAKPVTFETSARRIT